MQFICLHHLCNTRLVPPQSAIFMFVSPLQYMFSITDLRYQYQIENQSMTFLFCVSLKFLQLFKDIIKFSIPYFLSH